VNSWTDVAGWTLVHFVWQGAIIGLASAALLRIMRRTSPQIRYVAACAALGAMLTAPLVTAWALSNPVVVSSGVSASGPAPSSARHEPAAPAPRGCEWCDYRPLCGPYEELRTSRIKRQDMLAPLHALRKRV